MDNPFLPASRRTRPERTGIRAPLGDLELAVMRCVWPCGDGGCVATTVHQTLSQNRTIALTTVLTTLDRLHDKGILVREKIGKAFQYRAALSESELQARIVEGVLNDLITQFPNAVAAYFSQPDADESVERDTLTGLGARLERLRAARDAGAEGDGADDA